MELSSAHVINYLTCPWFLKRSIILIKIISRRTFYFFSNTSYIKNDIFNRILSLSGSPHEFSQHADPVIEEPDDPVVHQRGQPDDTAVFERGQHHIPTRSSQSGHQEALDRAVHRWRWRWWRNNTYNFTHDVRDGLRRLRLRRIRRKSTANRSGSARWPAGSKSGMIQRAAASEDNSIGGIRSRILSRESEKIQNSFLYSLYNILLQNIFDIFKSLLETIFFC